MKKYAYYLISDIHLERKNIYKKDFVLNTINGVIEANKINGQETIIVFAGDVDNGTAAYDWFKKINAQIIYTAGNHEFWKNDFYETLDSLNQDIPSNVKFLYNNFVECGDYIFVGATMWTDVGKTLNDDLKYKSDGIMNDNHNITAKKWYTQKNIQRLNEITSNYEIERKVKNQTWNILIEQEENEKTILFFNEFAIIRNQLLKLREEFLSSDKKLKDKYMPMSNEKYEALHKASKIENFSYKQWLFICKEHKLLGYDEISDSMIENVSLESEQIFKQLGKLNYHKELIVVSHHLPFLEERLIGYYSHIEKSKKLFNEKADSSIYTIQNGLNDYPHHNYFYRIMKGEFSRDESILEAIHYSNNGAINLPQNFLKNVKAWCHGHDHTLNYQDFIKGVPIVTNPMSYSLDVFRFNDEGVHLNDTYKHYHKIDTQEKENEEVQKLRELILKPIYTNELSDKDEMIKLWVFSMMDVDKIYGLLESFTQNNKKAFTYLAKNPQFAIGDISDKQYQKLQEFMFANYYYYNELNKELDRLDVAYSARKDSEFSYMNKVNKLYTKEITEYFYGNATYHIYVDMFEKDSLEEYGYDHLAGQLFKNIFHLNKGLKRAKHLVALLDQFKNIDSITQLFNQPIPDLYPKENKNELVFDRDLEEKKRKIMDKYLTPEVTQEKEKRHNERFNF